MDKDAQIADEFITRQVSLLRFGSSERGRVLTILRQMEEELVELLFYSGRKLTDTKREDLARLLRQAQDTIEEYYGQASQAMAGTLGEIARIEAAAVAASLETAFRGAVSPALPTDGYFKRLVDKTLVQGAPSAAWWKKQSEDTVFKFEAALRTGLAAGETNAQLISRIMGRATGYKVVEGKRVYSYAGGVMDAARHNAAALVQTSVQAVANQARRDTLLENLDVVKGLRQVSTLDGHTTVTCVAYSGAAWSLPGYEPIAPNKTAYNGGTPRHWNCRSVEIPITRSFRELGLDVDEFDPSGTTRSASGGPVAADLSFSAYLKRRGDAFADDLLGPGRAQLWRDKKITLRQLLDQNGRELSLAELRKLYNRA